MKTLSGSGSIHKKCFKLAIFVISMSLVQFPEDCQAIKCYAGNAEYKNGNPEGGKKEVECSSTGICTIEKSGKNITYDCTNNVKLFQCLEKRSGQIGCITGSVEDFEKWDNSCKQGPSELRRRRAVGVGERELCACDTDHCNDYEDQYGELRGYKPYITGAATLVLTNALILLTSVTCALLDWL